MPPTELLMDAAKDLSLSPKAIAATLDARIGDAFALFGMHDTRAGIVVRTFQPDARKVEVLNEAGAAVAELPKAGEGFFAGVLPVRARFKHRLRVTEATGARVIDDPYRFPAVLGDLDSHLIAEGTHLRLYERLGAHPMELEGIAGTHFAEIGRAHV